MKDREREQHRERKGKEKGDGMLGSVITAKSRRVGIGSVIKALFQPINTLNTT